MPKPLGCFYLYHLHFPRCKATFGEVTLEMTIIADASTICQLVHYVS